MNSDLLRKGLLRALFDARNTGVGAFRFAPKADLFAFGDKTD